MSPTAPDLFPYVPAGPTALDFWHWAIHNADAAIDSCPEAGRLGRSFLEYVGIEPPITSVTTVPGRRLRPGLVFVDVWASIDGRAELLLHGPGHVRPGPPLKVYFASRPSAQRIVRVELESAFVPHMDADAHFPNYLVESRLLPLLDEADGSHPAISNHAARLRGVADSRRQAFEDATSDSPTTRRAALLTAEGQWAYMLRAVDSLHESARDQLLPWGLQRAFPAVDFGINYPKPPADQLRYRLETQRSGPVLAMIHTVSGKSDAVIPLQSSERIRDQWKTACARAESGPLTFEYEPLPSESPVELPAEGNRIWHLPVADYHCDTVRQELGAIHAIFMELFRENG